mgnify:CR=1 FL=1
MLQQLLMNTYLIWCNKNTTSFCILQKQNALNILNNRPKFEAVVSECDNILNSINQSQSAPSRPAPEFDEFRQYIDQRITTQETLLQRIAQELGLDKPK